MQVACCQFDIQWEDKPANYRRVAALLNESPPVLGGLMLLPEMFATGFTMNAEAAAEDDDSPTAKFLSDLSKRHRVHFLAGVVSRRDGERSFNEAMLYNPAGERVRRYAKTHLFSYGGED